MSAQELLDLILANRRTGTPGGDTASPRVRERIIVEKFDHERGPDPVLIETVDLVLLNGSLIDHTVTVHEPPVGQT